MVRSFFACTNVALRAIYAKHEFRSFELGLIPTLFGWRRYNYNYNFCLSAKVNTLYNKTTTTYRHFNQALRMLLFQTGV
jgi:hypothetical protein